MEKNYYLVPNGLLHKILDEQGEDVTDECEVIQDKDGSLCVKHTIMLRVMASEAAVANHIANEASSN